MPKLLLISHLRLGQKSVQVGEPETLAKSGGNAWAALRTAHASVGSEPLSSILVRALYRARTLFQNQGRWPNNVPW